MAPPPFPPHPGPMRIPLLPSLALLVLVSSGCTDPEPPAPDRDPPAEAPTDGLTSGEVRQWLYHSLANAGVGAACFDGDSDIRARPVRGEEASRALAELAFEDGSELARYAAGLRDRPEAVRAVRVTVERDEPRSFLYVPNDGSFGVEVARGDSVETGRGVLFDLTPVDTGGPGSCVDCKQQSGQRGQGCTCTTVTVRVCCYTTGCSPTCGTGYECPYTCNRSDPAPWDGACETTLPFEDGRPFASASPDRPF